ncbi:hypothetical protein KEM48_003531 [Puccinia striiformis f. sp. tritici PST-130]|nr:hypothetical protein KEM48_003531 [Puccinia striiformis f. sp. tritici PST-130]
MWRLQDSQNAALDNPRSLSASRGRLHTKMFTSPPGLILLCSFAAVSARSPTGGVQVVAGIHTYVIYIFISGNLTRSPTRYGARYPSTLPQQSHHPFFHLNCQCCSPPITEVSPDLTPYPSTTHLDIFQFNSKPTPPPSCQVDTLPTSYPSHTTSSPSSNMLHNTTTHHRSFSRGLPHSIPFDHLDICPFNSTRTPPPSCQVDTLRPPDHSHITSSPSSNMLHTTYSINTLQHTQSPVYSTLDHCSILAQMVRSAHPNFRAQTVNTRGTSRRNRTQRGWERNALQEQAEQDIIQRDIRTSQRLGHVDADHDPGPAVWEDIDGAPHAEYEPHISSNAGQGLDEYIADLPSAAHASYHRARRYAEKRDELHKQWLAKHPKLLPFCKCTPDVIRLIHYGFFASSPNKPRTAFSIRLVQFHHHLWESAVISASAFVKGLSAFLDTRKAEASYARGGKYSKRNLRVPFSHSVDLYARILVNRRKILDVGLQLIRTDLWAAKCPRCFGPKQSEQHYTHASKDNPDDSQYPRDFIPPSNISPDATAIAATDLAAAGIDIILPCHNNSEPLGRLPRHKVGILYDLGCHLESHVRKHRLNAIQARADYYTDQLNGTAAHWLLNKLEHAQEVQDSASRALAELYAQPNRFTPGRNYSSEFLDVQWQQEQAYHLNSNQTAQSQAIELGRLLCLTAEVNQSLTRPMTAAQMLARINTINNLAAELATHRQLMGPQIGANLTATQADELAKLWYTKQSFVAVFLPLLRRGNLSSVSRALVKAQRWAINHASIARAIWKAEDRPGNLQHQARAFKTHHPRRPAPHCLLITNSLPSNQTTCSGTMDFSPANDPWQLTPSRKQASDT